MLRHAFERLEGGNILWQIVGPAPPVPPIFSLFLSPDLVLLPVWLEYCCTRQSRGLAIQPIKATKLKRVKERERKVGGEVGGAPTICHNIHGLVGIV